MLSAPQGTGQRQGGFHGEGDAPVPSGRGQVRVSEASGHTATTGSNGAGGHCHTREGEDTNTGWNSLVELARGEGSVSQQGLEIGLGIGGVGLRLCILENTNSYDQGYQMKEPLHTSGFEVSVQFWSVEGSMSNFTDNGETVAMMQSKRPRK